jgi:hypothetical protein
MAVCACTAGVAMTEFNKSTKALDTVEDVTEKLYWGGWNSALELAAYKVEHEFAKAFGKDTLSSMAIYIRSLKK